MKPKINLKNSRSLLVIALLFSLFMANGQVEVPFAPRIQDGGNTYINIKGDYTFLANGIVNRYDSSNDANDPYNGGSNNNGFHRDYIDIDGDATTFSSSSSTLALPFCSRIYYAGLYWSGNYQQEVRHNWQIPGLPWNDTQRLDFTSIKLKVPGGSYIDVVADNAADPVGEEDSIIYDNVNFKDSPYVCYKNVTNELQALADPNGEYFVANVRATRGVSPGGAGGWTLVIIYENPTLPGKYISTFDGYAGVSGSTHADINVSGFNTIPVGNVKARLGASVVEGDRGITGDAFRIQTPLNPGFTSLSNGSNPANNFFNSNITIDGADVSTRNIASTNTLGYDADIFEISNPTNSVIENDETSATLRLYTEGDAFGAFLVAFGVEIIEPNIVLEKKVEDIGGNDITGLGVNLGQVIDYVLSFVNTGNDDANNYIIRDILPLNVTLDEANITMPAGTTYTYNPATREIIYTIPNNIVEEGDPVAQIRMRVKVAENCFDFVDACTDQIHNLAYSTYEGVINDNQITDDPSVSDFDDCGFTTPGATNFLLDDLSACDFSRTVQLCGDDVLLDAGDNFDDYIWYLDVNENSLIDAGDTIIPDDNSSTLLVSEIGIYIVDKIIADPCKGFQEIITVEPFGGAGAINPIAALINDITNTVEGEVVTCPNDGEQLPKIFLCGLNDTELISINIPDAQSIQWEQLNEASCAISDDDCANKIASCTWDSVGSGFDFLAENAGQYRVVVNYQNGCFTRYYFNIFKNPLDPNFLKSDILCNTQGNITVTNMPANYEFRLIDQSDDSVVVPYSANNGPSFSIANNGAYTVQMRQQGVVDGCVFELNNIGILNRDFQADVDQKDTDCNGLGEIAISALNADAQYYYEISQGGTSIDTHGPTNDNNYTFVGLSDGVYDVLLTTDDGCSHTEQVTILDVTDLAVTASTTKHIDCEDGSITVNGTGGVVGSGYAYAIWSYNGTDLYANVTDIPSSAYQIGANNNFLFNASQAGDYEFVIIDNNNCPAFSNSVTISIVPAVEYTTSFTDENCFSAADGTFTVNVTNSNGYSLSYVLTHPDLSTTTNASGTFTGLEQGDFSLTVTQTQGLISCDFVEIFTIGGPIDVVSADAELVQDYTCAQTATIRAINISGGAPPYEYSIDGVNFVSGLNAETFTNLTNGTYTITVRDSNLCPVTTNAIIVDPLNEPTDLTFTNTQPTCPALESNVTVTAVNGNAPFNFEIIAPSAVAASSTSGNTAVFNALSPDTYLFRVTDNKGCSYEESFTIADVTPIGVVGQLISNITCYTDTDGEALYTVSGFNASYDYSITGPSSFSGTGETNTTIPLTGLDDGTYSITVTDTDTNCTATTSVIIAAPTAALTLSASETQPTCTSDGNVTLTASGGWGGNTFELSDGTTTTTNTTGVFTGLIPASYSAIVTDINNCTSTPATFVLNASVAPTLAITPNNICYTSVNGLTLTASVTAGGDGNYEYSLNNGAFSTNAVFSGLSPGMHTIDVRDGNNCIDSASITINPELSVTAIANNITACGTTTNVNITAVGGDGNYIYALVANNATPIPGDFGASNSINVTAIGDYDVYVRDKNGGLDFCETKYDINIAQDAPVAISVSNTDILCSGESTSTLTINASGGEAPYTYSIDNGGTYQPTNSFANQAAGSYNIRVRDANNCDITQIYTITEPFTLSASAAVTELVECNPTAGAEVRITNAQGGNAPYAYSFDGGSTFVASPIGHLLPGTHTIYIRDANNCDFPMTVTVDPQPTAPNASFTIDYECDGEGVITVTPDSPAFDYTYEIDSTPNTPDTSNIFSDVAVGNHTITVNYISNTPAVPSNLLLEDFGFGSNTSITQIDPVYCYEPQDGSASLCGFGTDPFIQDGEYSVTQSIDNLYSGWVNPNDHTGNVNGRFLAINVGGVAGVNGIVYAKRNIEVIPNRAVTISLWAFNIIENNPSYSHLGDPSIVIQLVDGSGNVIIGTPTGNVPKNNNANDWHNYTVTLNPGANTNLDIVIRTDSAVTGGNDIAIDDIEAFQTPEPCPGSFDFDVLVEGGNAFTANATSVITTTCNGASDGSITFEIENFDPVNGFEYSVNGSAFSAPQFSSPITVSSLLAGTHNIVVRDILDNSCSITVSETIANPTSVVTIASITSPLTCIDGAVITANASGGTPNYEYQLEDTFGTPILGYDFATNTTNNVFTVTIAGDYFVRARDTNLCEDLVDSAIQVVAPQDIIFTSTPTPCYDGSNGEIVVDVTSGNGGYQFSLDGGPWMTPSPDPTVTTYTFGGLTPGTYTIDVKDQYGCPLPLTTQTRTIETRLLATVATTDVSQCADGNITVTASGGDGSYEYAYVLTGADPTGLFVVSNTFAVTAGNDGDYDVYVQDNSAVAPFCEFMETVTIDPVVPLAFTATPTDPECYNGLGSIEINISSGTTPYIVQIIDLDNGGASDQTNTNVFTPTRTYYNLLPGNYTINVTDSFGCLVADTPVTITNPDELTGSVIGITPPACTGDPNDFGFQFIGYTTTLGTIQFSADGGTTWTGDNSIPGTTDLFTGYVSGNTVFPSMRTVDVSNNTVCITSLPPFIIPYPLDDLDISVSAVVVNCNELQVTVQGAEGTPDYQYNYSDDPGNFNPLAPLNPWSTPAKGLGDPHTFTGLVPGRTYVFFVRDFAGCVRQSNVNVNNLIAVPLEITSTYEPTCSGGTTGSITYTVSDNLAPFGNQFRWTVYDMSSGVAVPVANSGGNVAYVSPQNVTVSGLGAGNYFIQVTEVDGGIDSCIGATENLTLEELNPISATLSSPQNITCNTPGLILIDDILGGGGTFTYTVTGPGPFVTITGTTDNPVEIIPGSPAGTYTVLVEDQYGCSFSDTIDVDLDPIPLISTAIVSNCPDEGEFQLVVTLDQDGIGPYSLSLNGAAYQNVVFDASDEYLITDLSSGTPQTVEIRDLNGCGEIENFTIYPPLEFTAIQTELLDCEGGANNNAEITINVTSGSGNYEYEITSLMGVNEARTALPTNPFTWTQASMAGTYTVIVYDIGTPVPYCQKSIDVAAPPALTPIFTSTPTNVTCNGSTDGAISVSATDNGIGPYDFEIISGPGSGLTFPISPVTNTANSASFTGLDGSVAGIVYTIRSVADNGCSTDENITIYQPEPIINLNAEVVEFGCVSGNNSNNATISIVDLPVPNELQGGSGIYVIYEFINDQGTVSTADDVIVQSGPNTVYTETNIIGGTYIINVYDDNGCSGTTTATILPFDELLSATAAITNPVSCNPGTDGEITITATTTISDLTKLEYSIDNGTTYQTSISHTNPEVFTGLSAGTYNFLIRHADTGCITAATETILDPNTFTIDVVKLQDVICFGTETGQVTIELVDLTYAGLINWVIYDTNGTVTTADDVPYKNGNFVTTGPTAPIDLIAGDYLVEIIQVGFPQCSNVQAFTISGPSAAITGDTSFTDVTCALNDGTIQVIDAQGGWGGYTYFVDLASNATPTYPGSYQASPLFTGLSGGVGPAGTDYQVWVADQNGCVEQLPNVNLIDPEPISASLQINQDNCTNFEGEIAVIGTVGGQGSNYTYQLIKDSVPVGSPQTSPIFSGLGAGLYEVLVADQWSCTFPIPGVQLSDEMNITSSVVKPIDCSVSPSGEITISLTGGSANIEYRVTFPDGTTTYTQPTGVFTGLTLAGTYIFEATDLDATASNCSRTIEQYLVAPSSISLDPSTIENVSCNGASDGVVTINLSAASAGVNADPIYTYRLFDAPGTTPLSASQTNPTFSGLAAGTYQIEVRSSKDCPLMEPVTITEPTSLMASATATAFACNVNNTASTSTITAIASGGTAPYLYSIDGANFQSSATFDVIDNSLTQNITVTVVDANNCSVPAIVAPIQALNVFSVAVTQDTPISCANPEEILLTITDDGNVNAYTYELLPIGNSSGLLTSNPTSTTATFDLTAPGTYTFRITDTTTGCYVDTTPYSVAPYDLIEVTATATAPVTCFSGTDDGEITINITDYTGAYTYEIFNATGTTTSITGIGNTTTNPMTISGMSGGNYFVRIVETNNPLCTEDSNNITIISPDMPLTAVVNPVADPTCTDNLGELQIIPTGGYTPYDIQLTNTTTGQIYAATDVNSFIFTGLSAGNFSAVITDNGGCSITETSSLIAAVSVSADITASIANLMCYGDTNSSISAINVANGSGEYQYSLNVYDATGSTITLVGGAQISPVFNDLGAGEYSITVSDGWNCDEETAHIIITEPTEVAGALLQSRPITCTTNGELILNGGGGVAPYEFSEDGNTYTPMSGGDVHTFTSVVPGTYQFYVRDASGCSSFVSNQITLEAVQPLVVDIDLSAAYINCTGESTAILVTHASGGLGNYFYELYSDSGLTNLLVGPQTSEVFNNLSAGTYYVNVTSGDCGEISQEVIITDPDPLQVDTQESTDVTCSGQNDGTITIAVSGGTGDIIYAISPNLNQFDSENTFIDLGPGTYDIIAQDQVGCFISAQFIIEEPGPVSVDFSALPEVCAGSEDGSIDLTILGGTAPYSTALNSNRDVDFVLDQTTYNNLAADTYVIFVRDSMGCETNVVVEIEPGVNINAVATPIYTCALNMPTVSISLELEDESVAADIMYSLDSTDISTLRLDYNFGNITPGDHYLTISHANGCMNTVPFTVEAYEPLAIALEQNNINEITAIASGGREGYTFYVDGISNGDDNIYYITRTDTYTVSVIDENGCEVSEEMFIEFIDIEIPNFFTPDNGDGQNDFWKPNNIEQFPEIITIIFDRYGREVYRMNQNDPGWDGLYQSNRLPTGDYWYTIKLNGETDEREFVGHFTLYR